jgi:hypothetical protein
MVAGYISTFFGYRFDKILGLLGLRAGGMPAVSQNLESKGFTGKIFHRKDLAGTVRRLD